MRVRLGLVLGLYLIAATLFALRTPRWQAPDEPAHFNYVRSLAQRGQLPLLIPGCYPADYLAELTSRHFPPTLTIDTLCYEAYQPPLYYLLAAPVARAATALGRDPLVFLRLFSVLIGAGVVLASAGLVRELFPGRPFLAVGVAGLVATVPMHLTFLSAVNNDGLAELLLILSVWQMLRLLRLPEDRSGWLQLGVLLGLGLITKPTTSIALPLAGLAVVLAGTSVRRSLVSVVRPAALAFGVALLFILPWFVRNSLAYGGLDVLGLKRHDAVVVGQLRTQQRLAERGVPGYLKDFALTTFHSFWGQFGWMAAPLPGWSYTLLAGFTGVCVVGLVLFFRRVSTDGATDETHERIEDEVKPLLSARQRQGLAMLGAWIVLNLALYLFYNLSFVQFQGRYLFPSLTAIVTFLLLGWSEWIARRYRALALGLLLVAFWVLDLWSLFTIIIPLLTPGT
ncbi:MAG: DUF2142 domain-containing protein [Ardenticatenaceae bacterium]|nr:DUF2142 domain-containing protein [Ardenticatenaceae bacterium]HBY93455.1 hypothetical protein [Chloroflexota bacterium]